jgi:hypothetical protein
MVGQPASHVSALSAEELHELGDEAPTRREAALDMRWRKIRAVCLAGVACVVVIALGASEAGRKREVWDDKGTEAVLQRLLQTSPSGSSRQAGTERARLTMQNLFAYVEKGLGGMREGMGLGGGETSRPVELLDATKPCDSDVRLRACLFCALPESFAFC